MQLMPDTADDFEVDDPFDPKQNVEAGARLLKSLLNRYNNDASLALSAYNAGPTRVDEAGGVPPIPETTDYVTEILKKLNLLKANNSPDKPRRITRKMVPSKKRTALPLMVTRSPRSSHHSSPPRGET